MKQLKLIAWKIPLSKIQCLLLSDIALSTLGLAFTAYFLYAWLLYPSWVHHEFANMSASGYLLRPEQHLFSNLFEYVFNLQLGEYGYYRPRALSFLIQYLDVNLSFEFYKAYPQFGIKLPSYAFSIIATVASFVWFWRSLFRKSGYGIALLGGASLLYYDVYMNTSFMVLRGGKFLVAAAGIVCITIFIRRHHRDFSLNQLGFCTVISFLLFLLATLDEQIVALIFFIAVVALIVGLVQKRVCQATIIFILSAAIYSAYYFFLGRWLFDKFTPDGIMAASHPHQFSDAFKVGLIVVAHAVEMLFANFIALGFSSFIFLGVFLVSLVHIFRQGKATLIQYMILSGLIAFPILLTAVLVASHPPIYTIHAFWFTFYLPFPIYVLFFSVPYSVHLADSKTDLAKILMAVAFIVICISGIYKMDILYQASCVNELAHSTTCGVNPIPAFEVSY